jgi:hypothetical protein
MGGRAIPDNAWRIGFVPEGMPLPRWRPTARWAAHLGPHPIRPGAIVEGEHHLTGSQEVVGLEMREPELRAAEFGNPALWRD